MNRSINLGSGLETIPGMETVDIDERFNPTHCFNLDLRYWPLPSGTYNLVRAYHVLEHLDNPLNAAVNVYRILKPDGIFHVQIPHEKSPDATRDWSHKHTRWNKRKMKWLAEPTEYTNGSFSFALISLDIETPLQKLSSIRFYREWWGWRDLLKYGNITATYRKVVPQ